jgi:hypothetical protein
MHMQSEKLKTNPVEIATLMRGESDTFLPAKKKFFLALWVDCMKDQGENDQSHSSR